MTDDTDPAGTRRAAFRGLIEARDAGTSVPESRAQVAATYGLSAGEVLTVEREGIDGQRPPLGDG